MPRPLGIAFDLNGTLSHDEGVYFEIFQALFAREGRPVTRDQYFSCLVGNTDAAAIRLWIGPDFLEIDRLVSERLELFLQRTSDGCTVPNHGREAVRAAASMVPVAVVSGAFRVEIDHILSGAGLAEHISVTVALDDVQRSKPDPEPYELAARRLGLQPSDVLAFEDTAVGIRSAKAAGLTCVAVLGSQDAAALAEADEIVERLDRSVVERLLTS